MFISLSYRVMFLLLYGQKLEQANREHVRKKQGSLSAAI